MIWFDLLSPRKWAQLDPRLLPFADLTSKDLPLWKLFRLSFFQVSVGMATALMVGTLNRVLIVELGVAAWLVATMVALPVLVAPFRALIGFRSDTHRSAIGWRRVPFIWTGSILQFGGLAIMPFALILLSGDTHWPTWIGPASAALSFLLVGLGMQTVQTAGLALATDLVAPDQRPRMVALMYTMLLVGMLVSALVFSLLLEDFSKFRLIQVVQGAAFVAFMLNLTALWKQEPRRPSTRQAATERPVFWKTWRLFVRAPGNLRFLVALSFGTMAFAMQDIILEPYGGEILGLTVAETTSLTALVAAGALVAFLGAAASIQRGLSPTLVSSVGALVGVVAFSLVIFAHPLESEGVFRVGTLLIGFGGGLFSIGTLTAALNLEENGLSGLAIGAWGAVFATSTGVAIALGGIIRDLVAHLAVSGALGPALSSPAVGYGAVYHIEIVLLFVTLVAMGPLVYRRELVGRRDSKFGLAEFPS